MRKMSCYNFVAPFEVEASEGHMFHLIIQPFLSNDVDDFSEQSIEV
jgi:hypothetical protein